MVETWGTQNEAKYNPQLNVFHFTCGQLQLLTSNSSPRNSGTLLMGCVTASGAPDSNRRHPAATHEVFSWTRTCEPAAQKSPQIANTFQFTRGSLIPVSYTHLRAHETRHDLVCRLLLEKKKQRNVCASLADSCSSSQAASLRNSGTLPMGRVTASGAPGSGRSNPEATHEVLSWTRRCEPAAQKPPNIANTFQFTRGSLIR